MNWLHDLTETLRAKERVVLATIISTSGSTPAAAFSKMVISGDGMTTQGTVGGGCMEGDVKQAAIEVFKENRARIVTFNLNEDDMVQGLICGGSLDVLVEPISRESLPILEEVRTLQDQGEDCVIATEIGEGGVQKEIIWPTEDAPHPSALAHESEILELAIRAHHRNQTYRLQRKGLEVLLEPVSGRPHLVIFGGGHVSKYISGSAATAGFRVTVVDDRPQFANPQRFPEADATLAVEYYEAFRRITIKSSTYIVIVTRGHRSDEEILEKAIKSPARYVGMIGSARKVLATYKHLLERSIPVESLKRVHAPMGLEIGAVTAEEIGVSVVAELIAERRGAKENLPHKSRVMEGLMSTLKLESRKQCE